MIKEFALEPDAITASYRDFCYFTEKFGISQGRVISEFPRKWRRMVCESAQRNHAGKVELTKIIERLRTFKAETIFDSNRPGGDGNKDWLYRALEEHERKPFAAIIASKNPTKQTGVMVAADLDESDTRLQAAGQRHITRTATEIVECVALLLSVSKTVKLIDPHFDLTQSRWKRMLILVLTTLSNQGLSGITLEIHRSDKISPEYLKTIFNSTIPKFCPAGITVRVFMHPEIQMHNRFILTDIGGASYGAGLDDNEEGTATPDDLVTLLSSSTFEKEWATYSGQTPIVIYS